ncbi:MDR family MFS transporter [Lacticaseibacillus thailandensis]|nr:MDR family MFS transporter [Lacticaseibacillus thailandensis]
MHSQRTNVPVMTVTVFIATFMAAIEGTIVSTAMPTIVGSLHGVRLMNWVIAVYLLTSAIATPVYGKLADMRGRKPVLLVGLGIFVVGSLFSGLSQSMIMLIIARAIQGVGAGAIMPVTYTIIADMYSLAKRAQVLGLNSSAWGIAAVVAPLLGGLIVDQLSWHWVFIINVPIGLITMGLTAVFLYEKPRTSSSSLDIRGIWWLALVLVCVLGACELLQISHGTWYALVLLVGAGLSVWRFIAAEHVAADPVISLQLFRSRTFISQNIIAALISGVVMGHEVYIPMWMQGILGMSATFGGFAVTPSSILWVVGSFVAGKMLPRMRVTRVLGIALVDVLVGIAAVLCLSIHTVYPIFLGVSAVLGFGFGIIITSTTVESQNVVGPDQIGMATSFNTLSRTLGQTLMISIYGIIFNGRISAGVAGHRGLDTNMMNKLVNSQTVHELSAEVIPPLRGVLFSALHTVYLTCAVVVVLALAANLLGHQRRRA